MKVCVLLVLLVLIALCRSAFGAHEAVARFNAKGITGYIRFTEAANGDINITVRLNGLLGNHNWHVHTLPIDQTLDRDTQCLSTYAGPHYDPFNENMGQANYADDCAANPVDCEAGDLAGKFGQIPMTGMLDEVDDTGTLFLSGKNSIVGRSIVIHAVDGTNFECATIRLQEEIDGASVTVLQATFISPLAGTIYLRQVMGEEAQIWGRLFWINDTDGTIDHNWHIHELLPSEEYRVGECTVGPHYDPTGMGPTDRADYDTDCTCDSPGGCEVGDLTGKHDQINVPANPLPYATGSFFFTDSVLNLTGTNSVMGRSIAVHAANSGGPIIACAPLVASEDLMLGVSSILYVFQRSPFEDTRLVVGQSLPEGDLSIVHAALSTIGQCLPEDTAPLYDNTYSPITPFDDTQGGMTPDRFRLGDLEQRYGASLTNGSMFSVFDLPVYGHRDTISGRTLRLEGLTQRNCWALQPMLRMEGVITAVAAFEGEIEGSIYFVQRYYDNGVLGNTYIFVDLYYTATRIATEGHNWHVHMNPPVAGEACAPGIGGHYNPFSVSLGNTDDDMDPSMFSNYRTDCSPDTPLRCESGDLSGKHGQLRLFSNVANRATYTFVDSNLHLVGEYSIIGRSIGLHVPSSEGGALFECAEVTRFYVSESPVAVSFPEDQTLRTTLASRLADPPTDVLVLAQEVGATNLEDGTNCVTATIRGLGATQDAADDAMCSIAMEANSEFPQCGVTEVPERCSGPHIVGSLLLLAACLLMALTSF